ncbi:dihydroneopterin triphosphate diphosphatase [Zophobihabitans entericus]|uniref:Dihydroneopterin triphosphate diphosphatase n=1 Tax=Zophobihabitans entericus TaxID=1635327 RepID=A0A6G9IBR2_9GAMM|nr:dihydroneopterin triphosphate diphosphatase [Zophobihabitans entericus]QIQ21272.1 dihydroneopterin triphosphate diphosphatase [Zophobihabitans entericus]
MNYKKPESVLVVIFTQREQQVLMLQRLDDLSFWQSVTGSLEDGETPYQTAIREVKEETGIDITGQQLTLIDAKHVVEFEIFPQFLHRYAPGVTANKEHWFYLPLPEKCQITLTEHKACQWLNYKEAADLTKSWNNREAILQLSKNRLSEFVPKMSGFESI